MRRPLLLLTLFLLMACDRQLPSDFVAACPCVEGFVCEGGKCVPEGEGEEGVGVQDEECTPSCMGHDCGNDGCGGSCGACYSLEGAVDNSLCVNGFCCTPNCVGKECGDDGCGGSCGSCGTGTSCQSGTCVSGVTCGNGACDDGEDCATCASDCGCSDGLVCYQGSCCEPSCGGKECGDDGCGGSCGECSSAETCVGGICCETGSVEVLFKNDEFSDDIGLAAEEVGNLSLSVQPGFQQGEAFGVTFDPGAGTYPIDFLGVEFMLAAPPNSQSGETRARIEFFYHSGELPEGAPVFAVETTELLDVYGELGGPLEGGAATTLTFEQEGEEHPPQLTSGKFTVAIRFLEPPADLTAEWGTAGCALNTQQQQCGCQSVAPLLDQSSSPKANVVDVIIPAVCSGGEPDWYFAEDVGISGDFLMRVRAVAKQPL